MCNSGYFLSYVIGLGTSYARSFLASTHARFYKELDRECQINGDFKKTLPWFTEIYKKKLPCGYDVIREGGKS